jgi:receptor expression-enhancing protein 5/6
MREIPTDKIALYVGTVVVAATLTPFLSKFPRSRGKKVVYHIAFIAVSACMVLFIPDWVQHELFSPGGVLLIGIVIPVYESVVAACSLESKNTTSWLQFWIASGSFSFATEFMDDITTHLPNAGEHWYEFEFFLTGWLMLPFTDGSGLLYEKITLPYLAPPITKLKTKLEGWVQIFFVTVNTYYMWIMWYAFLRLSEEQRRFLVVGLGTVYPLAASTVALTTASGLHKDKEFWLTYWVCYSLLFVMMDYAENFIGRITGFYSVCAAATLYLFLPMFRGADVVFRKVLVPLSGQHENMLLHDALQVKLGIEAAIPQVQREKVMNRAASLFTVNTPKES